MTRFHDLDALRAFAMLLGIVLHAGLFLLPTVEFWPVHDKWFLWHLLLMVAALIIAARLGLKFSWVFAIL